MLMQINNMLAVDQSRWQAGRLKGERDDCAVSALSCAFDVPYAAVHKLLAEIGRKDGRGTPTSALLTAAYTIAFYQKKKIAVATPTPKVRKLGDWLLRGAHDAAAWLICGLDTADGVPEGHVMALRTDAQRLYNYGPASVDFTVTVLVAIEPAIPMPIFGPEDLAALTEKD